MKRVAIMQPYFLPYLGYFSLIKHTNEFILLDTVQFIRHGWIERNRVLKEGGGWLYIKVPLLKEDGRETLIKDARVDTNVDWPGKILAQLQPYKRIAPHFQTVSNLLSEVFDQQLITITEVNQRSLKAICRYLGFERSLPIFSEMNLSIESPQAPDEWALHICQALGDVDEYWNPPGGQEFFDRSKYAKAGITLRFHQPTLEPYDQKRQPFEPGLSIIDVLMFNSPEEVNTMLDTYELL